MARPAGGRGGARDGKRPPGKAGARKANRASLRAAHPAAPPARGRRHAVVRIQSTHMARPAGGRGGARGGKRPPGIAGARTVLVVGERALRREERRRRHVLDFGLLLRRHFCCGTAQKANGARRRRARWVIQTGTQALRCTTKKASATGQMPCAQHQSALPAPSTATCLPARHRPNAL